jgi:hypothetical protein
VSIRSLVAVAVVVWSVAVLVAVFLGLPMLLMVVGVDVDAGLIVNALVAIGTFSAAAAAVWVATSDRRERKEERDAADDARARLVVLWTYPRKPSGIMSPHLRLDVNPTDDAATACLGECRNKN